MGFGLRLKTRSVAGATATGLQHSTGRDRGRDPVAPARGNDLVTGTRAEQIRNQTQVLLAHIRELR